MSKHLTHAVFILILSLSLNIMGPVKKWYDFSQGKTSCSIRNIFLSFCSWLLGNDFFKKRFYLFIFREMGREGEREGEKYQCVVASHTPTTEDKVFAWISDGREMRLSGPLWTSVWLAWCGVQEGWPCISWL